MKKEGARLSFDSIFGKKRKKKENPSPFFSLRVLSPPSLTKGKGSLSLSFYGVFSSSGIRQRSSSKNSKKKN